MLIQWIQTQSGHGSKLRLDMSSTSKRVAHIKICFTAQQRMPNLQKQKPRSVFYYGTILLKIIHPPGGKLIMLNLAVGCFPSWKKVITFLSSIGIYFNEIFLPWWQWLCQHFHISFIECLVPCCGFLYMFPNKRTDFKTLCIFFTAPCDFWTRLQL